MSKCDLEVVLASPGPFIPGDTVEGFVGVTVNKGCTCRALKVQLGWFTHGRGNRDRRVAREETVFEGPLVAGEKALYPFSLVVPSGPFTFDGKHVSVGWEVRATADIPWAFDPKDSVSVQVFPGTEPISGLHYGTSGPLATTWALADSVGSIIVSLLMIAVGGLFLFVFGFASILFLIGGPPLFAAAFAAVGIGVPLLVVSMGLKRLFHTIRLGLGSSRLGNLTLTVPRYASPGQTLPVSVSFSPKSDLTVHEIRLLTTCVEIAVSGSGTKRRTWRNTLWTRNQVIAEPDIVPGMRASTFSAEVELPSLSAWSFSSANNTIQWQTVVTVDCKGPLDGERTERFVLRPPNTEPHD